MESETFLSKANTEFALALFKEFSDNNKTGNIFYSPFSISAALAMVRLGAAGNTATEISQVLRFSWPVSSQSEGDSSQMCEHGSDQGQDDSVNVDASFSQLLRELNKPDALYALKTANKLYGEQTFMFNKLFLDDTKKYYDATLEKVDFCTRAEASRTKINNWVKDQTKGKIRDLLLPSSVDSLTKLVLVNAIYFKGKWELQFDKKHTTDATFHLNKRETKTVKMMYKKSSFRLRFVEDVNCQILELPYKGKDLSMIIILPNAIEDNTTGLEKLESELTYENFKEWTRRDKMPDLEVGVSLPRFKMEESYDLKKVLTAMGMVDAFDIFKSDFSGMSESNDLTLSAAVHKAFVDVNEEGTEAAAAAAFKCVYLRGGPFFVIDHPFLFFIKHIPSGTVLFAGRFCSPE